MAIISGVVLGIGKVVSGVVTGTAKGLAVAGKATAKGISATGKVVGKAASATGKAARASGRAIGKATRSTAKGLQKAVKSTKKSMSNFGKRISKRKTGTEKLKRNANKTKSKLTENIKKIKKQRLDRERIQKNVLERKEIRNMEKNIQSSKTPTGKKVQSILKSPMSIIDKLFGLGSILLTGIVVNAIDDIIKKFKEFKENNQGLFDNIAKILTVIKDSFVYLFDEMTKPFGEEGSLDGIAKFDDDGNLRSGILYDLREAIKKLKPITDKIDAIRKGNKEIASLPADYKQTEADAFEAAKKWELSKTDDITRKEGNNEFNKKTYYVDQNGIVRFKKDDVPAILWNATASEEDKKILDRKNFNKNKISKIDNIETIKNTLNFMNVNENTISYIFAYQKYIEYVPLDLSSGSGSKNEKLFDYSELKLPSIWTSD